MKLVIAHLYPSEMNIYGDRGNILALTQRLKWRNIYSQVITVEVGDKFDFKSADIIFGGGGQDRGQLVIAADLKKRAINLKAAIEEGVCALVICGTYQLFGHEFTTKEGQVIPGIGIFDAKTTGSEERMIGNIIVSSPWGRLVGFENHSGQTQLAGGQQPLGRVIKGYGNNSRKDNEGAVYKNAFGSYLHGPLLPKNPRLADEIIARAVTRKSRQFKLKKLDDDIEHLAAKQAASRRK